MGSRRAEWGDAEGLGLLVLSLCLCVSVVNEFLVHGFEADAHPGDSFGLDDENALSVGDFDEVVGLVGDEHGPLDVEVGVVVGHVREGEVGVAFAVEFGQGFAELVGSHA